MNNANPLIPQGSLLEQQAKNRPHLRIALCIVAVHLVFLGGLLMQGCKPETSSTTAVTPLTNDFLPPLDASNLYTGPVTPAPGTPPVGGGAVTPTPVPPATPPGGYGTPTPYPPTTPPAGFGTPVPPVDLTPPPASQPYVVAKGDSFYTIGKKFGVSASAIAKANPGVDPTRLQIGQKLEIPAAPSGSPGPAALGAGPASTSDTYTVKSGDTLLKIARTHGTTVPTIREMNGLKTDRINVGQKLKLPAKVVAPEPTPAPVPMTTPGLGAPAPAPLAPPAGSPVPQ